MEAVTKSYITTMTERGVTDMSKFKIRPYRDGLFKVWELKDMGSGYCWEDVKRVFQTEEEAQKYIDDRKER